MNTKYNMFDFKFIKKYNEFLDKIEKSEGPAVMVTIGSHQSKAFSSGFNLAAAVSRKHNRVLLPMEMIDLFCRILTLNVPTLAVINGHAVAGGLYLAQVHDRVIMIDNPKCKLQLSESLSGIGFYSVYLVLLS